MSGNTGVIDLPEQSCKVASSKSHESIIKIRDLFPEFSSLGARESGLIVRRIVEEKLENYGGVADLSKVILDFEGIELITQGFGDEIVGVILRRKGLDFVKSKIKVINANNFIRGTLNWVVSYSKKMIQNNSSSS